MKQKFALSVADTEIKVVTEESKEMIDTIVGIVDRRIREINQKSKNCPKSEAALLLCLDYCADRLALQKKLKSADSELVEAVAKNEELTKEIEDLKKQIKVLTKNSTKAQVQKIVEVPKKEEEIAQLTIENIVKSNKEAKQKKKSPKKAIKADKKSKVGKKALKPSEVQITADGKDGTLAPSKKKISNGKVRSMFDMITFDDINN